MTLKLAYLYRSDPSEWSIFFLYKLITYNLIPANGKPETFIKTSKAMTS